MTYSGVEITTELELDAMYTDLVSTYATSAEVPEDVVICPLLNPLPHPDRASWGKHLADSNVKIISIVDDATGRYTVVGIWATTAAHGSYLTAAWGPSDSAVNGACGWALVDFLKSEFDSAYTLYTNAPGWVARAWFEEYMPQDGGPWDVSVTHPGMPEGTTLSDWDDEIWKWTLSRPSPSDDWSLFIKIV